MVEDFGKRKVLAVSRDSLHIIDGRTSLSFTQQKNNTTLAQSMSSKMTRTKVFVMMGIIILLLVGGIAAGLTWDRIDAAFGTTLATVHNYTRII